MKANRVNWDFNAFHDWSQSFERCAVAPVTDADDDHAAGLGRVLTFYAADVAADAVRLLAHAESTTNRPPGAPRTVRVLISTDNAAARVRSQRAGGGLNTRIDLLDAAGRTMPWAVFHSVALMRDMGDWPAIETPARADVMRDIARWAATAAAEKVPPVLAARAAQPSLSLRVYAGTAWDRALACVNDGGSDVLRFESDAEFDTFFAASATRAPC